jgi:hypothetical protein
MKKRSAFGDMTPEEIEKFEKESNSIVLFYDERGINFQKSKEDGNDKTLFIVIDGMKKPIVLYDLQINALKSYLNSSF